MSAITRRTDKAMEVQKKLIAQCSGKIGSQAELARKLGYIPQNFNRYATGDKEIGLGLYLKLLAINLKILKRDLHKQRRDG